MGRQDWEVTGACILALVCVRAEESLLRLLYRRRILDLDLLGRQAPQFRFACILRSVALRVHRTGMVRRLVHRLKPFIEDDTWPQVGRATTCAK